MKIYSIRSSNVHPSFGKIQKFSSVLADGVKITKTFNDNVLIAMKKTYPWGGSEGFRQYPNGYRVDYYTISNKIKSFITKDGQEVGHSIGDAYRPDGRLNVVTLREIRAMIKMARETVEKGLGMTDKDLMKIFDN